MNIFDSLNPATEVSFCKVLLLLGQEIQDRLDLWIDMRQAGLLCQMDRHAEPAD